MTDGHRVLREVGWIEKITRTNAFLIHPKPTYSGWLPRVMARCFFLFSSKNYSKSAAVARRDGSFCFCFFKKKRHHVRSTIQLSNYPTIYFFSSKNQNQNSTGSCHQ
jgi:hypothetical protein